MTNYLALTYGLSVTFAVGMFIFAMVVGFIMRRRINNTENFITARKQVRTSPKLIILDYILVLKRIYPNSIKKIEALRI